MAEYKFPLTFACPGCGCEKTVSQLTNPEQAIFTYMRRETLPLKDSRLAGLTVRTMVRYFDQCARCGMDHCTKVEIQNAPITAVKKDQLPRRGGEN